MNPKKEMNLDAIPIPYILKDRILMSPGTWNNYYYSPEVIEKMYKNTDWNNPRVRALFLDHIDDRASEWIGEVRNVRFENGNLIGDLIIVDKPTAIKLAYGAKFGVSPKVIGDADYNRRIYNGNFENFSIVINPAVKTTFLNSQVRVKEVEEMAEEEKTIASEEEQEVEEEEQMTPAETQILTALKELKTAIDELKQTQEELKKKKRKEYPEPYEAKEEELKKKKKKYPEPYEAQEQQEEQSEQKSEELKQEDEEFEKFLEENVDNSEWTKFVAKYIKEHKGEAKPSELMKRAAKEFKKKKKKYPEPYEATEKIEEVKVATPSIEELEEKLTKKIEAKFAEFSDPLGGIAQRYLTEKKVAPSELDKAIFEIMRRGVA